MNRERYGIWNLERVSEERSRSEMNNTNESQALLLREELVTLESTQHQLHAIRHERIGRVLLYDAVIDFLVRGGNQGLWR